MADGSGSATFMNLSDSAQNGTKMEIDGFTSNTMYTVTVEESIETKQWVLPSNTPSESADEVIDVQPAVGVTNYFPVENTVLTENGSSPVQQDDMCGDDLFSIDELSAGETTVGTADVVTSVSGSGYEQYLSSGEIDGTQCVPGVRSELGLNETDEQDISLKVISGSVDWTGEQSNDHLLDKEKEENLEGTVPLNRYSVDIETNDCSGQGLIRISTLEGCTHESLQLDDDVKTDVYLAKESGEINDDQQTSEVLEKSHILTENHMQTEPLTADANQLKEAPGEVDLSTGNISQREVVKYDTDQVTSELSPVVVTSTEEFVMPSVATDVLNNKNTQLKHSNNDSSECCREYLPKDLECESDLKQSQMIIEQMRVSDEKQLEPSAMEAEEDMPLEQAEIAAKRDEQESQPTQEIEMPLVKEEEALNNKQPEETPIAIQASLGNDLQAKSQDVNQIPTIEKIEPQERQVCIADSAAETNELSANMTQKEHIVSSDANLPHEEDPPYEEEQSKNVQHIGNDLENMSKIPSQMPVVQGTIESHVEHIEDRDDEQRQLELLKGRKVAKKFGRRKYMGEVIGYDPASKWFKVLYEDGDEEELEKHEVDAILILHKEEASVSRKRQLSPTNMDHEESNRSEKKSRKVDRDGAPARQKKTKILKDETPGSHRLSDTKKQKSNAAKSGGKSKSPKTNVRKGQKGTGKSTSTKKSIGKNSKKRTAKKSQSSQIKEQPKSNVKEKSRHEGKQDSAEQPVDEVMRKLKYGSSKKKTPTKAKRKTNEIPKKGKESEIPEELVNTKPEVDSPGRKRKAVSELEGGSSTVSHKRTKRAKVVNDLEAPPEKRTELTLISEDTSQLPSQAEEDKPHNVVPTGKKGGRGTDLVGRKVKKDFGKKFFGGEVVGYKVFYKVEYEDGDSEDLTWKELEPILLPDEDHIAQGKSNQQHQGTKHSSTRSKGKKKI